MLNGVSLFSGVGGLELALYEEVKTVAYCEREPYAQAVLIKRMQEGSLDSAPIYDDVRTFPGKKYRRRVDIVFGGFPCQDISVAGNGEGIKKGNKSGLWFDMVKIIGDIRPTFIFLENVSAITNNGLDTVLAELSKTGYDVRWTIVRASDVGARHKRARWFCLAYPKGSGTREYNRRLRERITRINRGKKTEKEILSNTDCERLQRGNKINGGEITSGFGSGIWDRDPAEETEASESFVGRVADGIPKRVDRLKCLGNAVVPQQGRQAWRILTNNEEG